MKRFGGFCKHTHCKQFMTLYGPPLIWWVLIWGAAVFFWYRLPAYRHTFALPMGFLLLTAMVATFVSSVLTNRRHMKDLQQVENELKRLEEEKAGLESLLIQTQKMEAIGTLAGGIAHDFNNMLSAILGNVELAQLDIPTDSGIRNYLTQVLKATHRAKELVRQILAFSRKSAPTSRVIDPLPTVVEALDMLRAILPATIEIQSDLTIREARIMADSTQLQQVVMNLCTNGAHAMENSGGILSVALKKRQLTGATAKDLGLAPGSYVALRVCDTGHGMSPETLQRIFDPFFTTKRTDKGTGMGLAMVSGIVKACSGSINVTSEPGKGTECNVFLPVVSGETGASRESDEPLPKGRESILFVDDEPFLVDLGNQLLSRLGYRVVACNSGKEAFKLIEANPHRFDLVITDYTMPGMTGAHLAQKLLRIRDDLPIIMCSGYCDSKTHRASSQNGIAAFVIKPLTIEDLAYTVRRVLDRPAAQSVVQSIPGWCSILPN
jgi:signal transduction histidine kinase/ActR/RegA family two-component response regulator